MRWLLTGTSQDSRVHYLTPVLSCAFRSFVFTVGRQAVLDDVSLTVAADAGGGGVSMATDEASVARQQELCDGREPAVDMATGRWYDCSACPQSSYCHRLSTRQSACCWINGAPTDHPQCQIRFIASPLSLYVHTPSVCLLVRLFTSYLLNRLTSDLKFPYVYGS